MEFRPLPEGAGGFLANHIGSLQANSGLAMTKLDLHQCVQRSVEINESGKIDVKQTLGFAEIQISATTLPGRLQHGRIVGSLPIEHRVEPRPIDCRSGIRIAESGVDGKPRLDILQSRRG